MLSPAQIRRYVNRATGFMERDEVAERLVRAEQQLSLLRDDLRVARGEPSQRRWSRSNYDSYHERF